MKTASYTLQSRTIGADGYGIPITPVALDGGSATTGPIAARDFRIYSVTIPPGAEVPSWQIDLTPTVGEMLMQVRRDSIPDFFTSAFVGESAASSNASGGKRMKRAGKESLLLLPDNGAAFLQPGIYYIAAVSEGVGPTTTILGAGGSAGTLTSVVPAPATDLGLVTPSSPISHPVVLDGGNSAIYRVTVPSPR